MIEEKFFKNPKNNISMIFNVDSTMKNQQLNIYFIQRKSDLAGGSVLVRLTTCPVLECTVRVADETSNRTIECPVLAQMIWSKLYFKHKILKSMFISFAHRSCYQDFWLNIACSKTFYGFNTLLLIQNLKAEICVKVNYDLNCSFFCDSVKNNRRIE